jgi:hypothetical protein
MKRISIFTILVILIFSFGFTACGPKNGDLTGSKSTGTETASQVVTVQPQTVHVTGGLGPYFEVINRDFPIIDHLLTIEVRRTLNDFSFSPENMKSYREAENNKDSMYGFGLVLISGNGSEKVIQAGAAGPGCAYNSKDEIRLFHLKKGETGFIRWIVDDPATVKSFRLTSVVALK